MENPIGKVGLFVTPSNMKELEDYISNFNGHESVIAWTCAMMAWNMASVYVDNAIEADKENNDG